MAVAGFLRHLSFSRATLVAEAARHIVGEAKDASDLSRVSVILPDPHAASELARAVHAVTGFAALLPRLSTLRQWAAEVPLDRPIASSFAREAAIYHALAERRWFAGQDRWSVAAELASLFEELTRWRVGMPASAEDFAARLERAYEAGKNASFGFEARLVHELWHAMQAVALDTEAAYQLQLGVLAQEVTDPIYVIAPGRLAPAESEFLQRCAERVPVVCVLEERNSLADPQERTLSAAWPQTIDDGLRARAQSLRSEMPSSGLRGRLRFHGAVEAEQEARAIAQTVRGWLADGRSRIAVVTLDRVVARRARALLERDQVLVRDEAGWPLSTTSAATAIGRWFELAANDCYHRDLLDLLKSPFAFADWPREHRRRTVWDFERTLKRASIRSGLERYLELAQRAGSPALKQMLERIRRGTEALGRNRRKSLAGWLTALRASLESIGVYRGFESDAAGMQLVELLDTLAAELSEDRLPLDFGEFRRWMGRRLEAAAFRDSSVESPVVFTSLNATRLRSFDAILVMGADASRLPGIPASGMFFNQRVRSDLGLPGTADYVEDVQELLIGLLVRSRETLVTWQRSVAGEPNLVSPLFERLRALHELAWGDALDDSELAMEPDAIGAGGLALVVTVPPAPIVPSARVPQAISASGYNALMACPYQFYARQVLGLRESDEVQEQLEKRDYGTRVHDILTQFHRLHPRVLAMEPAAAEQALHELSDAAFAADIRANYVANAWLARWRSLIPRYLAWQRNREEQGWRFYGGEIERSVTIETPGGRSFVLRGRIDRVDVRDDGAVAVIDYKTRKSATLEQELESPGEDVQLPVYALLWGEPVTEALYLSMDADEVEPVELAHAVALHAEEVRARLAQLVDRMSEGEPLPAQGIEAHCQYCEMDGLCRRKHWS